MPASRLSHAFAAVVLLSFAGCGDETAPAPTSHARPLPGRIVYQKEVRGAYQLFTVAPDGSGTRQITRAPGAAVDADWSPDGRRIVFEYDRPNENGCAVVLINADGSGRKDLSGPDRPCDLQPSFTPDGRRIVFVRYDEKADKETIRSMNLAGKDVRLIGGHLGDTDPNVSPDGRTVSFVRRKKDKVLQAVFAIGIDGHGLRQLTSYRRGVANKHAWSPDGERIAYTENADWARPFASANIETIAADGSDRRRLTHYKGGQFDGDNAFIGSYSPDGEHIVGRVERNDAGTLAIMDADGGNLRIIGRRTEARPRSIDWGDG